jgi:hypothetical protein
MSPALRQSFRMSVAELTISLSFEKAKLLTRVGMAVTVRKYRGGQAVTKTLSLPRELPLGIWVVSLAGLEGEYDCGRVMPIEDKPGDSFSLESEAA